MTTIQINEKTKIGKKILELLNALALEDNNNAIKFLDETEYLLSTKANKDVLMQSVKNAEKGTNGKTIKTSELWK